VMSPAGLGFLTPLILGWKAVGWAAVDLFFVLSGFLVSGLFFAEYRQRQDVDVRRFVIRRGFKIWPPYVVYLAVLAVWLGWQHWQGKNEGVLRELWPNLLHVQNYFHTPRIHTWSLALEEHFYLGLALFFLLLLRTRRLSEFLRVLPACVLGALAISAGLRHASHLRDGAENMNLYASHLRLDGLLIGTLLAYWSHFHREKLAGFSRHPLALIAVGILLAAPVLAYAPEASPWLASLGLTGMYAGFGLILLGWLHVADVHAFGARLVASRPAAWLGEIGFLSYSIYLWHVDLGQTPMKKIVRLLAATDMPPGLIWVIGTAGYGVVAILAGWFFARLIENPSLRLRDRLFPSLARGTHAETIPDPRPSLAPAALLLVLLVARQAPSEARAQPTGQDGASWLRPPAVGDHELRALTPTLLEVRRITTKPPDPRPPEAWNFVTASGRFLAPPDTQFQVSVEGVPAKVAAIGFKRRVAFADLNVRDLRIDNALYLRLAAPVAEGRSVVVTNPDGQLWPANQTYTVSTDPLRHSPAIHVNQEGYAPSHPKKAMIGYYLGDLGELPAGDLAVFRIARVDTGETVFTGLLTPRRDVGYTDTPPPYQNVLQADFSAVTAPGSYRLVVPGLGASTAFRIDDGVAMNWLRTYALGLLHQRCGFTLGLPFTRFAHDACHLAPAGVPVTGPEYSSTWATIASKSTPGPLQTAPRLKDPSSQLYPFVNKGPIDVSGGHHDAGDYSKYTINVAALVHTLVFTADAFPAVGALDNLGLPESGDGIGDLLQEARIEADLLAKLQDADGGFYFLVYPRNREYENDVPLTEGRDGDPQVVWPKNTAATAAAVAALAQCASSPAFKRHYPAEAEAYLEKARLGWSFLSDAIAQHGTTGSYQKITFYGDEFAHNDELSWAATELYLATGDADYQRQLLEWFPDPGDPATFRWGWVRLAFSYGNAIRSYAFAARTGRLRPEQLDRIHLKKCEAEIAAAAELALLSSRQNAYATGFPEAMKRFRAAGWYFSLDQAADLAVAHRLWPRAGYIDALVGNLNYEGGTNPLNLCFVSGLGLRRPQVIVHQFANNDSRRLPPTGLPLGNIQAGFDWLPLYGRELGALTFPADEAASAPYPFYDRWSDAWNTTAEFITLNQARSILALAALVEPAAPRSGPWKPAAAIINAPDFAAVGSPVSVSVQTPGLDHSEARIVWEGRDQEPGIGPSWTLVPRHPGPQWIEVEVAWPDGRRAFGTAAFNAR
jgi:peptidoglycan/LPS O-acetylase OafA/YrhL